MFSTESAGALTPSMTVQNSAAGICRTTPQAEVTAVRHTPEMAVDFVAGLGRLSVEDRAGGVLDADEDGVMRIPLTNAPAEFALIDADDYDLVKRHKWRKSVRGYAVASERIGGKTHQLVMHRIVLMLGPLTHTDHRNRKRLDNRRANLRKCTPAENARNSSFSVNNTSGVKGIRESNPGLWTARVVCNRIPYSRSFKDILEAKKWIEGVRSVLHGDFACNGTEQSDDELDEGLDYFAVQGERERLVG